jgi:hypothetical protein
VERTYSGNIRHVLVEDKRPVANRSIPTINGTGNITENIGETKNRGLELQITSNNIAKKDFDWSTTFNLSHYKTRS